MTNYDFENILSPIDFEYLIRDLLSAELNIELTAFAEGKDQGIDLRYSKKNDSSIIVQCKRSKNISKATLEDEYGVMITNPPYGDRMGEEEEVTKIYKNLGKLMKELTTWSNYVITSDKAFEKKYGKKADRKRKLYNGRLEVDYYQYYGPRPDNK